MFFRISVTNQTGQLEALTYGCRSYIVQKDSLVATFVREILKDHGLGAESRYMDDKTLAIQIGTSQDPNGKCIAWDCDKLKDLKLTDLPFSDVEGVPNRVTIMTNDWKMKDPWTFIKIQDVNAEDDTGNADDERGDETQWSLRGMTRTQWKSGIEPAAPLSVDNEASCRMAELSERIRSHRVDTTRAGMHVKGHVTIETAAEFWGCQISLLRGDVKYAYDMWKTDCEIMRTYLATRTLLMQGFVGFHRAHGKECNTIVKGLARYRPDVIILLASDGVNGKTLRGSAFVRYHSEVDARDALNYFHGRRFGEHYLHVTLSNCETQARVWQMQSDSILLQFEDIIDMSQCTNVDMSLWGEVNLTKELFGKDWSSESHFGKSSGSRSSA
jgi:hypothetical protein